MGTIFVNFRLRISEACWDLISATIVANILWDQGGGKRGGGYTSLLFSFRFQISDSPPSNIKSSVHHGKKMQILLIYLPEFSIKHLWHFKHCSLASGIFFLLLLSHLWSIPIGTSKSITKNYFPYYKTLGIWAIACCIAGQCYQTLQFWQIHFAILTNTFYDLDKYIWGRSIACCNAGSPFVWQ